MDVIDKITTIIEPSLQDMGYAIVQLRLLDGKQKTLSLMVERADEQAMSFDDCTEISHVVSALLDVEDPITSAYHLEVCSPGLDRPLVKFSDYERYLNYEAKLETLIPLNGQKRFRGVIIKAKDGNIVIKVDGVERAIVFSNIKSGKLVVTEDLLKTFLKQTNQQQENKADKQNKQKKPNKKHKKA